MIMPTNFASNRTCRNGKPSSPQAVITAVRHMFCPPIICRGGGGALTTFNPTVRVDAIVFCCSGSNGSNARALATTMPLLGSRMD